MDIEKEIWEISEVEDQFELCAELDHVDFAWCGIACGGSHIS